MFYKLISAGIESIRRLNGGTYFEWPEDTVEFAKTIEAHGGEKTSNLLRGPGKGDNK